MEYALEHHQVPTNGLQLHVVQCGPLDGPLVILLHGFPDFWYGWHKQLRVLAAAGYRVWVPDQRGYNLSDKPSGIRPYTLPTLAADIIGLIDAAGRPQASLVGHDWGGIVAWHLATYHASRISRAAILNVPHPSVLPVGFVRLPTQLLRSWYVFFFQLPWVPEQMIRRHHWRLGVQGLRAASHPGTFTAADIALYKTAWAQPRALTSMLNWYRAFRYGLGQEQEGGPRRVHIPIQIIWGKQDVALDARLAVLSQRLCDQAELHYFPEASHWVQHDEAAEVNALLVKFLAGSNK
jgi:pimeloyl-ACP methyl ester carboxylesterase